MEMMQNDLKLIFEFWNDLDNDFQSYRYELIKTHRIEIFAKLIIG